MEIQIGADKASSTFFVENRALRYPVRGPLSDPGRKVCDRWKMHKFVEVLLEPPPPGSFRVVIPDPNDDPAVLTVHTHNPDDEDVTYTYGFMHMERLNGLRVFVYQPVPDLSKYSEDSQASEG
jgi:hypothetical protein